MGIVEGSFGYRSCGVSISGKIRFIKNPRVQDEGDRHLTNRSSDPRVAYPKSKFSYRTKCELCILLPFCPTGCRYPGKILFIEPKGVNGHRRFVPGARNSGAPQERSQATFRDGSAW